MSWLRLDDQIGSHPKTIAAENEAFGAWVRMDAHACAYLTDGFITTAVALHIAVRQDVIDRLVSVGYLDVADGGYVIHDFHDWNPRAEDVKAKREEERRRKGAARTRQSRDARGRIVSAPCPEVVRADSERTAQVVRPDSARIPEGVRPESENCPPVPSPVSRLPSPVPLADASKQTLPPVATTPSSDPLAGTPAGIERAAIEAAIAPVSDVCDRCGGAPALAKLLHTAVPAKRPGVDAGEVARLACVQILGEIGDGKHKVGGLSNLVRAAFVRLYTNPAQAAVARGESAFGSRGQPGVGVDADHESAEAARLTARVEAERRDREQQDRARAAARRTGSEASAGDIARQLTGALVPSAGTERPAFGRRASGGDS